MITSSIFTTETHHSKTFASNQDSLRIKHLEQRIDKLYLIVEALWLLTKEKYNIDDEKLTELIVAIDMKDGRRDGKVAPKGPLTCQKCGKVNSRKHLYCIYCGAFLDLKPFE